jgi:hypothetical protein
MLNITVNTVTTAEAVTTHSGIGPLIVQPDVSFYLAQMVHGRSGTAGSDRLRATMPSPPVHTAALTCHPGFRSHAVRGVRARVSRTSDGMLSLAYSLEGERDRIRVPRPGRPRIAERLWEHTCCEVFIARAGQPAYHEFNLAPSGEWAAYAFARYREGALLADEDLDPRIAVRSSADGLALEASISLHRLAPALADARLALALSAVLEDDAGGLSYWALKHPPGKPDFHHPDAFALDLDEVRG